MVGREPAGCSTLFAEELLDALTRIVTKPNSCVGWPTPRRAASAAS